MDDMVKQALARWPDVPDCTGWLALDARGRWRIGEAKAGPRMPITHAPMIAFINRNYASAGRSWVFQNGPQRVFVELEYTPFVWRLHPRAADSWALMAHTGASLTPSSVWLDDEGRFLVQARSESGEPLIGVVHDHDTALVLDLLRDDAGQALDDEAIARLSTGGASAGSTSVRSFDSSTSAPKAESSAFDPPSATSLADEPAADAPAVCLQWRSDDDADLRLPLHRIPSHRVAARFGFEPRPSLALRVDVDTRR